MPTYINTTPFYQDVLIKLPTHVLECRAMGHTWFHKEDQTIRTNAAGEIVSYERREQCERCTATRIRAIDVSGPRPIPVGSYSMRYPSDYFVDQRYIREYSARVSATMALLMASPTQNTAGKIDQGFDDGFNDIDNTDDSDEN